MTFDIYIRLEAEADIEDAAAWYQTQVAELGYEFLDEIKKTLQIMVDNPVVMGVIHASRNPHDWKKRLN